MMPEGERSSCLFCEYASGKRDRRLVHEDALVVAFAAKHPRAHQHWLVVPRQHIRTIAHVTHHELPLLVHMQRIGMSLLSHGAQPARGAKQNYYYSRSCVPQLDYYCLWRESPCAQPSQKFPTCVVPTIIFFFGF